MKIGKLRSIIAEQVGVIALTATATKGSLKIIQERLSLKDPELIGLPPSQPNIVYRVLKLPKLDEFCNTLSHDLQQMRQSYPKTVIFVTVTHSVLNYTN